MAEAISYQEPFADACLDGAHRVSAFEVVDSIFPSIERENRWGNLCLQARCIRVTRSSRITAPISSALRANDLPTPRQIAQKIGECIQLIARQTKLQIGASRNEDLGNPLSSKIAQTRMQNR